MNKAVDRKPGVPPKPSQRDSATALHEDFIQRVQHHDLPAPFAQEPDFSQSELTGPKLIQIFESQVTSRLLDLHARKLRATGDCFYTIGSSGHEGNAAVAAALKVSDPAFLHYRSGGFFVERSKQLPGQNPVWDLLTSFTARAEDAISGGRHKVLGSKSLNIPPQTSTIASHLPKAVGAALSIAMAHRMAVPMNTPDDGLVLCNFGDASTNHSSAQGAFNLSSWCAFQNLPLPLIWLCEDNGLGISVNTPKGWIEQNFQNRPGLHYLKCNGLNAVEVFNVTQQAQNIARSQRRPVFLHMKTVRLLGHAGADAEVAYRSQQEIDDAHSNDPLLHTARILISEGLLTPDQVLSIYHSTDERIKQVAKQVCGREKLTSKAAVLGPIEPTTGVERSVQVLTLAEKNTLFKKDGGALKKPQPLGRMINFTLAEIMAEQNNVVVFGEDVGKKGGVYHVTARLQEKFGPARVFNTLLDETSILGTAIGLSQNNILPIPEIQFLAYVHNAEDQIRGEASTLSFFSNGQFTNPMVIRVAGLAYQKGFGGHFHNDNSFAVFRDLPGVIIACPSNGLDASRMLRTCVQLAQEQGRVVIFLEPIALYMTRDLHEAGDEQWAHSFELEAPQSLPLGELGVYGQGRALCLLSYGNGYYLSRQVAEILNSQYGVEVRVVDLRWLAPLNEAAILAQVNDCERVLVVDECRQTGSISEALFTLFLEQSVGAQVARICAEDSFIPLGDAANLVLPSKESILAKAKAMLAIN